MEGHVRNPSPFPHRSPTLQTDHPKTSQKASRSVGGRENPQATLQTSPGSGLPKYCGARGFDGPSRSRPCTEPGQPPDLLQEAFPTLQGSEQVRQSQRGGLSCSAAPRNIPPSSLASFFCGWRATSDGQGYRSWCHSPARQYLQGLLTFLGGREAGQLGRPARPLFSRNRKGGVAAAPRGKAFGSAGSTWSAATPLGIVP